MKNFFDQATLPTTQNFDAVELLLSQLKSEVATFKVNLTSDERRGKRKTGPRRYAYAKAACNTGGEFVNFMPRDFEPSQFEDVLSAFERLARLQLSLATINEHLEDTLMAAGIDCMTYTRIVHAAIRNANQATGECDEALSKLDDFNAQSQKEEAETPETPVAPIAPQAPTDTNAV